MGTLLSNSGGLLGKFKDGLSNLSLETIKTSKVMSLISLTNPFFLALTIGGGIVAAFVTNLFGFRDAINQLGVAIGNALGPLKPFLTMIGSLGEGVVNALGMGGDATKEYAATTTDSMDTVNTALGTTKKEFTSYGDIQKGILLAADGTTVDFTNAFIENMGKNVTATGGFNTALATTAENATTQFGTVIGEADKVLTKIQELNGLQVTIPAPGVPGN